MYLFYFFLKKTAMLLTQICELLENNKYYSVYGDNIQPYMFSGNGSQGEIMIWSVIQSGDTVNIKLEINGIIPEDGVLITSNIRDFEIFLSSKVVLYGIFDDTDDLDIPNFADMNIQTADLNVMIGG